MHSVFHITFKVNYGYSYIHDIRVLVEITIKHITVYHKCLLVRSGVHFNHISKTGEAIILFSVGQKDLLSSAIIAFNKKVKYNTFYFIAINM